MAFNSEEELAATAKNANIAQTLMGNTKTSTYFVEELKGVVGIPDYVIFTTKGSNNKAFIDRAVTVEFKLKNWKRALEQAFRYKFFSNKSFVVLDEKYVHRALARKELFKKYKVGLASVDNDGKIIKHFNPALSKPYDNYTFERFTEKIRNLYAEGHVTSV